MQMDEQRRAENFAISCPLKDIEDGMPYAIPLTQSKVALVSADDYERVKGLKWFARQEKTTGAWYAYRNFSYGTKRRTIAMHRFIMGTASSLDQRIDHVNLDGLDNRRSNLRVCNNSMNQANTRKRRDNSSGFKGVSRNGNKWRAYIQKDKAWRHIGNYATPEEAHEAYSQAAKEVFGEFARSA